MALGDGAVVGSARVRLEVDRSRFDRDMARAKRDFGRMGRALGGALKAGTLALGGAAVGAGILGKRLGDLAGDAEEVDSKFNVVFGKTTPRLTKEINAFSKATGASRYALKGQVADIGALLKPMIGATGETGKMSVAVAKLSTDLSSFNNVPVEESLLAIRAGLVGESEPLRRFGVLLNEAKVQAEAFRITGKKNADQLTDAEKVQARYNLIMRQTKLAQGDAERTAGSYTNQMRRLRNRLTDVGTDIGKVLLPGLSSIVEWLNEKAVPALENFSDFLGDVFKEKTFKGKAKIVFTGLGDLAKQLWDALFAERRETRKVVIDGRRMQVVLDIKQSLAAEWTSALAGAIGDVNWTRVGTRIADGIKVALAETAPAWDALGRDIETKLRKPSWIPHGGIAEWLGADLKEGLDKGLFEWIGGGDYWNPLRTEAAKAATGVRTDWQRSMERVSGTATRALKDVRGQFAGTSKTALTSKDRVEELRGEIGRLRSKKIAVETEIKFRLPSGFRSDAFDRASGDGLGVAIDRTIRTHAGSAIPPVIGLPRNDVASHLWDELGMAAMLGLSVSSTHRPGAVTRSGNKSYHSYFPSKAIDLASGSTAGYGDPAMRAMFNFAEGRSGLNEVILDPWLWTPSGRRSIAGTQLARDHRDHVHIGGTGDGLGDAFALTGGAFRSFMGDGVGRSPRTRLRPFWRLSDFGLRDRPRPRGPKEKAKAYKAYLAERAKQIRELSVGTTPGRIQLAIAQAGTTATLVDDIEAAGKQLKWFRHGRGAKWLTQRQRIDMLTSLESAAVDLERLREEALPPVPEPPEPGEPVEPGEPAPPVDTGPSFEAQAQAFLAARAGIVASLGPSIMHRRGGGFAPGSASVRHVTHNWNFTTPPQDPYVWLRKAQFVEAS